MDVIIMPLTTSLLKSLKNKYPQFSFKKGDDFSWSSSNNTIFYDNTADDFSILLVHELSHALLGHELYESDIQLIIIERQAWDYAVKLASSFDIEISDETIQLNLDTYRDWLHKRSTCPACQATGLQSQNVYKCLACNHQWQANQARKCNLRRYKTETKQKTYE